MIRAGTALLALLALPTPAAAQQAPSEVVSLREELTAARAAINRLEERLALIEGVGSTPATPNLSAVPPPASVDPSWSEATPGPLDGGLPPAGNGTSAAFELLAGTGSGRATFSLSRSSDRQGPSADPRSVTAINDAFELTVSAPLSKDGETSFATLDGLTSGTKIELGFTRFYGRFPTRAVYQNHPALVDARKRCRATVPAENCTRFDDAFFQKWFTAAGREQYIRDLADQSIRRSFAWSVRAALGYDKYSFFQTPSLNEKELERVAWSVGGGITMFPLPRSSLTVNLDYQRSFKAGKSVVSCPATSDSGFLSCVSGPLSPPSASRALILSPAMRVLVPVSTSGLLRNVGFAPRGQIDFLSGEFALDLPIYLVADAKNGLVGGFRVGYESKDENRYVFGIFIGKQFSIFQ